MAYRWFPLGTPPLVTLTTNIAALTPQGGTRRPIIAVNCVSIAGIPSQGYVFTWTGSQWTSTPTGPLAYGNTINAVAANGYAAVVFHSSSMSAGPELVVGKFTSTSLPPNTSRYAVPQPSSAADVVTGNQSDLFLIYVQRVGTDNVFRVEQVLPAGQYRVLGSDFATPYGWVARPRLLVDSQGILYRVLFTSLSLPGAPPSGFRAVVENWNGQAWNIVTTFTYPAQITQPWGHEVAMDPNDNIFVGFCQPISPAYSTFYAFKYSNNTWAIDAIPPAMPPDGLCRFAFNSQGTMIVVYHEPFTTKGITLAWRTGSSWDKHPVPARGASDFAVMSGPNNTPIVAWRDTAPAGAELGDDPVYVMQLIRLKEKPFRPQEFKPIRKIKARKKIRRSKSARVRRS